jgi:hypothetical protein
VVLRGLAESLEVRRKRVPDGVTTHVRKVRCDATQLFGRLERIRGDDFQCARTDAGLASTVTSIGNG